MSSDFSRKDAMLRHQKRKHSPPPPPYRTWQKDTLLPFPSPTTIMVSGSTQSGKTIFTKRLLENANGMFTVPPRRIVFWISPSIRRHETHNTQHRLPSTSDKEDLDNYSEGWDHVILVLYDLMLKITQWEDCVQHFMVTSHHRNITVLFLTQTLYPPGIYAVSIYLNCCQRDLVPGRNRQQTGVEFSFSEPSGSNGLLQRGIRHGPPTESATDTYWLTSRHTWKRRTCCAVTFFPSKIRWYMLRDFK